MNRHPFLIALLLVLTGILFCDATRAADPDAAEEARREKRAALWKTLGDGPRGLYVSGRYDKALAALKEANTPANIALKARVLLETGKDVDALSLLEQAVKDHPDDKDLLAARGLIHERTGAYDRAEADYTAAVKDPGERPTPSELDARLGLLRIYNAQARREKMLDAAGWFFDFYRGIANEDMTAPEAYATGRAVTLTGEDFKTGIRVMALAQKKEETFLPAFIGVGDVFAEKYQYEDAAAEYQSAITINPYHPDAHVGLATVAAEKRDFEAVDRHARAALSTNPRHVPALLAFALLEFIEEDYDAVRKILERALAIHPNHEDALLFKIALAHADGRTEDYRAARDRLLAVYGSRPLEEDRDWVGNTVGLARIYLAMGQMLSANHRIEEALPLYRKAVELDEQNHKALAALGICLMRHGREEDARQYLDAARQWDPYNVWVRNLLLLLRRNDQYVERDTRRFSVKMFERDAPVLGPYLEEAVDAQLERCETAFGFRVPKEKVYLSVLKSHADFSARVSGLPRMDASGATFGPFVALVSPNIANKGQFINWRSVMLHELAHVVTLMGSQYRIPRWLTEGMSVYMQGWRDPQWEIPLKLMIENGPHPDLNTWNRDFTRPKHGWQVPAAYAAAGLFVTWFVEAYGRESLPRLVKLYGEGKTTDAVFQAVTGKNVKTLNAWLKKKLLAYGKTLQIPFADDPSQLPEAGRTYANNPDVYPAALRLLRLLVLTGGKNSKPVAEKVLTLLQRPAAEQEKEVTPAMRAEGYCLLGILALREKDYQTARLRLDAALGEDETYALAQHLLGVLNVEEEMLDRAEARFRKAMELYPRFMLDTPFEHPYRALARLLLFRKQYAEAAKVLQTFVAMRRDDPLAYRYLAHALEKANEPHKALAAWRDLFAIDPYVKQDHERAAALYDKVGKKDLAKRERDVAAACPAGRTVPPLPDAAGGKAQPDKPFDPGVMEGI